MKKLVFVLAATITFMGLMTGCSNTQNLPSNSFCLSSSLSSSGAVTQSFMLPTFASELKQIYDEESVNAYISSLETEVENKIYNIYYLKYYLTYLNDPKEELSLEGENVKLYSPKYNQSSGKIEFGFTFLNQQAWRYYQSSNADKLNIFDEFIEQSQQTFSFPFASKTLDGKKVGEQFKDIVFNVIVKNFAGLDLSKLDYTFEYQYISPYSRLKSNADVKVRVTSGYLHSWSADKNLEEKQLKVYVTEANKGLWYLSALAGILIIMIVVFGLIFINQKRNRKKCYSSNK